MSHMAHYGIELAYYVHKHTKCGKTLIRITGVAIMCPSRRIKTIV